MGWGVVLALNQQLLVLVLMLMLVATLSAAIGIGMERWLFFAEAEHVAMLYYGRQSA